MMNYEILANLYATESVPDSWSVVVADVKGSTEAVRMGRYRDVNLAGAACIAAVRNAYSTLCLWWGWSFFFNFTK